MTPSMRGPSVLHPLLINFLIKKHEEKRKQSESTKQSDKDVKDASTKQKEK